MSKRSSFSKYGDPYRLKNAGLTKIDKNRQIEENSIKIHKPISDQCLYLL